MVVGRFGSIATVGLVLVKSGLPLAADISLAVGCGCDGPEGDLPTEECISPQIVSVRLSFLMLTKQRAHFSLDTARC